jgi:hypothetical protein
MLMKISFVCRPPTPYLFLARPSSVLTSSDSTYQIAIWSEIETGLGITAGSLITLRPLFRWLLDGSTEYNKSSRGAGKSSKRYPLYSRGEVVDESQNTKFWRPDIELDDYNSTVISAASPRGKMLSRTSSQEALNPELGPGHSRNHVTIQKTFVQTFSERQN